MSASRVERRTKARAQRKNVTRVGFALLAILALAAAGTLIAHWRGDSALSIAGSAEPAQSGSASQGTSSADKSATGGSSSASDSTLPSSTEEDFLTYAPIPGSTDATLVEVPNVVGRAIVDARALLEAADLTASYPSGADEKATRVISQQPAAGNIALARSNVVLGLSAGIPKTSAATFPTDVVVLDPGHQSRSDTSGEPIGPGSTTLKPRITGGATGVGTRVPEYEAALEIAMNVSARLQRAGVKVVMTRTTNDVNISNAERARIANDAHASLFVRIHTEGNGDARVAGVRALYPAVTQWTRSTSAPGKRAASLVQTALLASTSAPSNGVGARSDLAGFNWCKGPCIAVECGYLSNPIEDRLLTSPSYQDKVAAGIASGILAYLGS